MRLAQRAQLVILLRSCAVAVLVVAAAAHVVLAAGRSRRLTEGRPPVIDPQLAGVMRFLDAVVPPDEPITLTGSTLAYYSTSYVVFPRPVDRAGGSSWQLSEADPGDGALRVHPGSSCSERPLFLSPRARFLAKFDRGEPIDLPATSACREITTPVPASPSALLCGNTIVILPRDQETASIPGGVSGPCTMLRAKEASSRR